MTQTQYAYRLETRKVREPSFPYNGTNLKSPEKVADFVASLQDSDIEKFIALHLSASGDLVCLQVQPGTVSSAYVYPRELIKHNILSGAVSMILVHNHPSGSWEFSDLDISLTRDLSKICVFMGINLLDHVLIHGDKYTSMERAIGMPRGG
jgi:DNA repair protein RadC